MPTDVFWRDRDGPRSRFIPAIAQVVAEFGRKARHDPATFREVLRQLRNEAAVLLSINKKKLRRYEDAYPETGVLKLRPGAPKNSHRREDYFLVETQRNFGYDVSEHRQLQEQVLKAQNSSDFYDALWANSAPVRELYNFVTSEYGL